jgi:hypothetical protein
MFIFSGYERRKNSLGLGEATKVESPENPESPENFDFDIDKQKDYISTLKKDNEQLKKRIKGLKIGYAICAVFTNEKNNLHIHNICLCINVLYGLH